MSDDDKTPPPQKSLHPVFSVTNIQNKVRILDGVKVTYSTWVNLFTLHARGHDVLAHIDGTPPPASADPTFASWTKIDSHVLQWIYGTLSDDLLRRVLEPVSTAYAAWLRVKNIFLNNKGARAASLEHEFTNLKLSSMASLDAYCQRLRELASLLKDVDAEVSDQRLVLQLVRGLPSDYDTVASYINQTLPNFETARSMLELEQHRTASRDDSATALVAPATVPAEGTQWPDSTPAPVSNQPRFSSNHRSNNNNNKRNYKGGQNFKGNSNNKGSNSAASPSLPTAAPYPWGPPPPWVSAWTPPPCPYPTYPGWAGPWPQYQPRQPAPVARSYSRASAPSRGYGQAYITQDDQSQLTDLGQAFHAMSMNPPDGPWFMDTGASSHLTFDQGSLTHSLLEVEAFDN